MIFTIVLDTIGTLKKINTIQQILNFCGTSCDSVRNEIQTQILYKSLLKIISSILFLL